MAGEILRRTLVWLSLCLATVEGMSIRKIYTVFTEPKTWNEAKTICETQYGQLVKLKTFREMSEIKLLDETDWNNTFYDKTVLQGGHVWIGLHKPFANDTKVYQDCQVFDNLEFDFTIDPVSYGKCGSVDYNFRVTIRDCNETGTFICERYEDDCWFEPYKKTGFQMSHTTVTHSGINDVNACALKCRNHTDGSGNECWGFHHEDDLDCVLYIIDGPSASTVMVNTTNQFSDPAGGSLYIRRCFEGMVDRNQYPDIEDESPEAVSTCNTTAYAGDPPVAHICFCSVDSQPPIPEPISSEAKAESLAKELIIDTSNTSSAQRKLVSAKDNRPSAVGVGMLGVAMLSGVFGGLMLMDMNVVISTVKKLISASKPGTAPTAPAAEPSVDLTSVNEPPTE